MRTLSFLLLGPVVFGLPVQLASAEAPLAFAGGQPDDRRNADLKNLNGYFPFQAVESVEQWERRQADIRRRILVSQGLWPLPTKTPLNAVVHGRVERDDYVVDRVYFQSAPGHFVTGSLYRPRGKKGPLPAILSPHGHWNQGRFYDAGEATVRKEIEQGAEKFEVGGRYPIQARAVQLARMGCLVFVYDMTGNADSTQIAHRPDKWSHLDTKTDWGFMSVQADLRLQNMMGLQTWNSIRAIDFLLELDQADPERIGVTGASGGGTQSMIISAVDQRIAASMPCVMVSTAMQGGCTCENAPLLRIDQGNIDIAAATAPRPLGLTAADDWTIELETKGYPDLLRLYEMLGQRDRLTAVFHTQFKHNYNAVNRQAMYSFFNRHFQLGWDEPIEEPDFAPLSRDEATVWTDQHPAPAGDQVGDPHEVRLLKMATADSRKQLETVIPTSMDELPRYREVVGAAWNTILGRRLDQVGEVKFTETGSSTLGASTIRVGKLDHVEQQEQLPVWILKPDGESVGTAIWVSDSGKASVYDGQKIVEPVQNLLDSHLTVIAADLVGQGEFLSEKAPSDERGLSAQRMWYQQNGERGWQRFSGYTYGYNHCLFAQRAHDVLSLIKYAQSNPEEPIQLVGMGRMAGPVAVAATSQANGALAKTVVDLGGFHFADVTRHDDPMFVPGAVKYFDVDGLLSLCAPGTVEVTGRPELRIAKQVYKACGAADRLVTHP